MALKKPTIRRVHGRWRVSIEASRNVHPWGHTYHPTFPDAIAFLDRVHFLVEHGFLHR